MKKFKFLILFNLLFLFGIQAQSFTHDFESSKVLAKENEKAILMIFSGSDWCKPCIQMKENIISNETFVEYAEANLVLLEVDFPYRKKNRLSKEQTAHNEALAEKYNPDAIFPLIIVMNENGKIKQKMSYDSSLSPEEYIQLIQKLK